MFLCASALETVRLLLNSRSPEAPAGLGNAEDLLGRYLLDQHYDAGASATRMARAAAFAVQALKRSDL